MLHTLRKEESSFASQCLQLDRVQCNTMSLKGRKITFHQTIKCLL